MESPYWVTFRQAQAERLQGEADAALAEVLALKLQTRLEDLTVWEMEKVKQSRKMDAEAARQKAREMKAEALGVKRILTEN